ncbi:MAG TPA: hypothetical protein VFQ97_03240 [Gallionella sp.]|nr:hypothetical protein [Gallionella sp.]
MAIMIPVTSFVAAPSVTQGLPRLLLIMCLMCCSGACAVPPDTQAEAGYMFDDNVTRAKDGVNKLGDRSYSVNLSQPVIFPIAEHERVLLTGSVGGEMFDRHKGLSRLTGAVHGEFQYRSSAEFGTPIFALYARMIVEQYQSRLRDGFRYSAGISMRQAVTDRIRIFGAMAHNERNGNSAVFDNKDNSVRINLDYSLGANSTIYLGGEYRRGDLVISGSPVWSAYNYNAYTEDDAFSRGQIYIFRFDGSTALSTIGYNLRIGARDSIDFSWRRARSSVNYVTPYWSNVALGYVTNQYSAAYLKRF